MTNTIQTRQGDPGKTPYQRAVELGLFDGTEAEYNASLQGEDGLPGPPGNGSPDTPPPPLDPTLWFGATGDDLTIVFDHTEIPVGNRIHVRDVFILGDQYVMLFGVNDSGIQAWIAFSDDGRHWYDPTKILGPPEQLWEGDRNFGDRLRYDPANERWVLFYEGTGLESINEGRRGVGVAYANNIRGPYTRFANNPIATVAQVDVSWAPQPADAVYFKEVRLIDGTWHAWVSVGNRETSTYSTGIVTADNPEGPWVGGDHNPIWVNDANWPNGSVPTCAVFVPSVGKWYASIVGGEDGEIGFAISEDSDPKFNWTLHPTPTILPDNAGAGLDCCFLAVGDQWRLFTMVSQDAGQSAAINSQVLLITSKVTPVVDPTQPVIQLLKTPAATNELINRIGPAISDDFPTRPNSLWQNGTLVRVSQVLDYVAVQDDLLAAWVPWISTSSQDVIGINDLTDRTPATSATGNSVLRFTGGTDSVTAGPLGSFSEISIVIGYRRTAGSGRDWLLWTDALRISTDAVFVEGAAATSTSDNVTFNTDLHVVVTYDGANIRTYRGGVAISTRPHTDPIPDIDFLRLGAFGDDGAPEAGFFGDVYDLRVYGRAITAAEVTQLFDDFLVGAGSPNGEPVIKVNGTIDVSEASIINATTIAGQVATINLEEGSVSGPLGFDLPPTVARATAAGHAVRLDQLGTAAPKDTGTAIGNVVELVNVGGNPGLPAVDGSALTGVGGSTAPLVLTTNAVEQRNGTNAQTYRLAKTYTSATDFESLELKATPTGYQIGSTVGSAGGSNQPVSIGHTDAAGNFTAGLTVENGEGVLLENGIQLRRLTGSTSTVIEHHTSNNLNVNAIGGGQVNFGNTSGGTFVNFSANGITAERGDVNLSGVNSGVHFATLGTSVDVQTARFRLKPLANQNLGFGSRGGFEFWTGGGVNGSTGTKTFEIDSDGKTNCGGGLSLAPITTAALLAITPAVDAGNFRVTDSTPPNQGVYPDGTNWRYYDNTMVS